MHSISRHVCAAVGMALAGAILATPALARSASEEAESAKEHLPNLAVRLVYAPTWDSPQSSSSSGGSLGTFEMEGGIGTLLTAGIGDKQSWHAEVEGGIRETAPTSSGKSPFVGSITTYSLMANGYYGFKIADKIDGYAGAGLGIASHSEEDHGDDLALGYQAMVGVGYKLTKKITANIGVRYFGTQAASLDRIRVEYGRPEFEVGVGYEF